MDEEVPASPTVPPVARRQLKVFVHPGNEYIASFEPESLQTLTYLKLASCTPHVSPEVTCFSATPVLDPGDDQSSIRSGYDIIQYLKDQGYDMDRWLTAQQRAEILAYNDLLTDRLLPALVYMQWLDTECYLTVTRKNYGSHLTFPISMFYLSSRHKAAERFIKRGAPLEVTAEERRLEVLGRAKEAITLLSTRLGKSSYFFGDKPSSLDALVYGYIEILAQGPLHGNNVLHEAVKSCRNLFDFCLRIRMECFPQVKERTPSRPAVARQSPKTLLKDPLFLASIGIAVLALGVQGARVGLFSKLAVR